MIIDQAAAGPSKRLAAAHSLTKGPSRSELFSPKTPSDIWLAFELAQVGPTTLWRSLLRSVTTIATDPNQAEFCDEHKIEAKKTRPEPGF